MAWQFSALTMQTKFQGPANKTLQHIQELRSSTQYFESSAYSIKHDRLLTVDPRALRLWSTQKEIASLSRPKSSASVVGILSLEPLDCFILTLGSFPNNGRKRSMEDPGPWSAGSVKILSPSMEILNEFLAYPSTVAPTAMATHSSSSTLLTVGDNGYIKFWIISKSESGAVLITKSHEIHLPEVGSGACGPVRLLEVDEASGLLIACSGPTTWIWRLHTPLNVGDVRWGESIVDKYHVSNESSDASLVEQQMLKYPQFIGRYDDLSGGITITSVLIVKPGGVCVGTSVGTMKVWYIQELVPNSQQQVSSTMEQRPMLRFTNNTCHCSRSINSMVLVTCSSSFFSNIQSEEYDSDGVGSYSVKNGKSRKQPLVSTISFLTLGSDCVIRHLLLQLKPLSPSTVKMHHSIIIEGTTPVEPGNSDIALSAQPSMASDETMSPLASTANSRFNSVLFELHVLSSHRIESINPTPYVANYVEPPKPKADIKEGKASGQSLLVALLPVTKGRGNRDTVDGIVCVSGGLVTIFELRTPIWSFGTKAINSSIVGIDTLTCSRTALATSFSPPNPIDLFPFAPGSVHQAREGGKFVSFDHHDKCPLLFTVNTSGKVDVVHGESAVTISTLPPPHNQLVDAQEIGRKNKGTRYRTRAGMVDGSLQMEFNDSVSCFRLIPNLGTIVGKGDGYLSISMFPYEYCSSQVKGAPKSVERLSLLENKSSIMASPGPTASKVTSIIVLPIKPLNPLCQDTTSIKLQRIVTGDVGGNLYLWCIPLTATEGTQSVNEDVFESKSNRNKAKNTSQTMLDGFNSLGQNDKRDKDLKRRTMQTKVIQSYDELSTSAPVSGLGTMISPCCIETAHGGSVSALSFCYRNGLKQQSGEDDDLMVVSCGGGIIKCWSIGGKKLYPQLQMIHFFMSTSGDVTCARCVHTTVATESDEKKEEDDVMLVLGFDTGNIEAHSSLFSKKEIPTVASKQAPCLTAISYHSNKVMDMDSLSKDESLTHSLLVSISKDSTAAIWQVHPLSEAEGRDKDEGAQGEEFDADIEKLGEHAVDLPSLRKFSKKLPRNASNRSAGVDLTLDVDGNASSSLESAHSSVKKQSTKKFDINTLKLNKEVNANIDAWAALTLVRRIILPGSSIPTMVKLYAASQELMMVCQLDENPDYTRSSDKNSKSGKMKRGRSDGSYGLIQMVLNDHQGVADIYNGISANTVPDNQLYDMSSHHLKQYRNSNDVTGIGNEDVIVQSALSPLEQTQEVMNHNRIETKSFAGNTMKKKGSKNSEKGLSLLVGEETHELDGWGSQSPPSRSYTPLTPLTPPLGAKPSSQPVDHFPLPGGHASEVQPNSSENMKSDSELSPFIHVTIPAPKHSPVLINSELPSKLLLVNSRAGTSSSSHPMTMNEFGYNASTIGADSRLASADSQLEADVANSDDNVRHGASHHVDTMVKSNGNIDTFESEEYGDGVKRVLQWYQSSLLEPCENIKSGQVCLYVSLIEGYNEDKGNAASTLKASFGWTTTRRAFESKHCQLRQLGKLLKGKELERALRDWCERRRRLQHQQSLALKSSKARKGIKRKSKKVADGSKMVKSDIVDSSSESSEEEGEGGGENTLLLKENKGHFNWHAMPNSTVLKQVLFTLNVPPEADMNLDAFAVAAGLLMLAHGFVDLEEATKLALRQLQQQQKQFYELEQQRQLIAKEQQFEEQQKRQQKHHEKKQQEGANLAFSLDDTEVSPIMDFKPIIYTSKSPQARGNGSALSSLDGSGVVLKRDVESGGMKVAVSMPSLLSVSTTSHSLVTGDNHSHASDVDDLTAGSFNEDLKEGTSATSSSFVPIDKHGIKLSTTSMNSMVVSSSASTNLVESNVRSTSPSINNLAVGEVNQDLEENRSGLVTAFVDPEEARIESIQASIGIDTLAVSTVNEDMKELPFRSMSPVMIGVGVSPITEELQENDVRAMTPTTHSQEQHVRRNELIANDERAVESQVNEQILKQINSESSELLKSGSITILGDAISGNHGNASLFYSVPARPLPQKYSEKYRDMRSYRKRINYTLRGDGIGVIEYTFVDFQPRSGEHQPSEVFEWPPKTSTISLNKTDDDNVRQTFGFDSILPAVPTRQASLKRYHQFEKLCSGVPIGFRRLFMKPEEGLEPRRILLFRGPPDAVDGFPTPDMPESEKEASESAPMELNKAFDLCHKLLDVHPFVLHAASLKELSIYKNKLRGRTSSSCETDKCSKDDNQVAVAVTESTRTDPLSSPEKLTDKIMEASTTASQGFSSNQLNYEKTSKRQRRKEQKMEPSIELIVTELGADGGSILGLSALVYNYFKGTFGVRELAEHKLVCLLDAVCDAPEIPALRLFARLLRIKAPGDLVVERQKHKHRYRRKKHEEKAAQHDELQDDVGHRVLTLGPLLPSGSIPLFIAAKRWLKERKFLVDGSIVPRISSYNAFAATGSPQGPSSMHEEVHATRWQMVTKKHAALCAMELLGRQGPKLGGVFAPPVVSSRLLTRLSSMPAGNVLELNQQDLHIVHPYQPAGPSRHLNTSPTIKERTTVVAEPSQPKQYKDLLSFMASPESSELIDSDLFIEALLDECAAASARALAAGRTLWSLEHNHARKHRLTLKEGDDSKKSNRDKAEWKNVWPGTATSMHNLLLRCITYDSERSGMIAVDLLDEVLRSGVLGWRSWLPPSFIKSDPASLECETHANKLVDVFCEVSVVDRRGEACYLDLIAFLYCWVDVDGKLPLLPDIHIHAAAFMRSGQTLPHDKLQALLELHRNVFEPLPLRNEDRGYVPTYEPPPQCIPEPPKELIDSTLASRKHVEVELFKTSFPDDSRITDSSSSLQQNHSYFSQETGHQVSFPSSPPYSPDDHRSLNSSTLDESLSNEVKVGASLHLTSYGSNLINVFNMQEPPINPGNLSVCPAPVLDRSRLNTPATDSMKSQRRPRKAATPAASSSLSSSSRVPRTVVSSSIDLTKSEVLSSNQDDGQVPSSLPNISTRMLSKSLPTSPMKSSKTMMELKSMRRKFCAPLSQHEISESIELDPFHDLSTALRNYKLQMRESNKEIESDLLLGPYGQNRTRGYTTSMSGLSLADWELGGNGTWAPASGDDPSYTAGSNPFLEPLQFDDCSNEDGKSLASSSKYMNPLPPTDHFNSKFNITHPSGSSEVMLSTAINSEQNHTETSHHQSATDSTPPQAQMAPMQGTKQLAKQAEGQKPLTPRSMKKQELYLKVQAHKLEARKRKEMVKKKREEEKVSKTLQRENKIKGLMAALHAENADTRHKMSVNGNGELESEAARRKREKAERLRLLKEEEERRLELERQARLAEERRLKMEAERKKRLEEEAAAAREAARLKRLEAERQRQAEREAKIAEQKAREEEERRLKREKEERERLRKEEEARKRAEMLEKKRLAELEQSKEAEERAAMASIEREGRLFLASERKYARDAARRQAEAEAAAREAELREAERLAREAALSAIEQENENMARADLENMEFQKIWEAEIEANEQHRREHMENYRMECEEEWCRNMWRKQIEFLEELKRIEEARLAARGEAEKRRDEENQAIDMANSFKFKRKIIVTDPLEDEENSNSDDSDEDDGQPNNEKLEELRFGAPYMFSGFKQSLAFGNGVVFDPLGTLRHVHDHEDDRLRLEQGKTLRKEKAKIVLKASKVPSIINHDKPEEPPEKLVKDIAQQLYEEEENIDGTASIASDPISKLIASLGPPPSSPSASMLIPDHFLSEGSSLSSKKKLILVTTEVMWKEFLKSERVKAFKYLKEEIKRLDEIHEHDRRVAGVDERKKISSSPQRNMLSSNSSTGEEESVFSGSSAEDSSFRIGGTPLSISATEYSGYSQDASNKVELKPIREILKKISSSYMSIPPSLSNQLENRMHSRVQPASAQEPDVYATKPVVTKLAVGVLMQGNVDWGDNKYYVFRVSDPKAIITVTLLATTPVRNDEQTSAKQYDIQTDRMEEVSPNHPSNHLKENAIWNLDKIERRRPGGIAKADLLIRQRRVSSNLREGVKSESVSGIGSDSCVNETCSDDHLITFDELPSITHCDWSSRKSCPLDRIVLIPEENHDATHSAREFIICVRAPLFQTYIDDVCSNLDDEARGEGAGKRYRTERVKKEPGSAYESVNHNQKLESDSGILFGGGGVKPSGVTFALFVHQSGVESKHETSVPSASLSASAHHDTMWEQQMSTHSEEGKEKGMAHLEEVKQVERALEEGWAEKFASLAGGGGTMKRANELIKELSFMSNMDSASAIHEYRSRLEERKEVPTQTELIKKRTVDEILAEQRAADLLANEKVQDSISIPSVKENERGEDLPINSRETSFSVSRKETEISSIKSDTSSTMPTESVNVSQSLNPNGVNDQNGLVTNNDSHEAVEHLAAESKYESQPTHLKQADESNSMDSSIVGDVGSCEENAVNVNDLSISESCRVSEPSQGVEFGYGDIDEDEIGEFDRLLSFINMKTIESFNIIQGEDSNDEDIKDILQEMNIGQPKTEADICDEEEKRAVEFINKYESGETEFNPCTEESDALLLSRAIGRDVANPTGFSRVGSELIHHTPNTLTPLVNVPISDGLDAQRRSQSRRYPNTMSVSPDNHRGNAMLDRASIPAIPAMVKYHLDETTARMEARKTLKHPSTISTTIKKERKVKHNERSS